MVSFWPFRGDDNSAASFEKELKQLSTKITKAQARHDSLHQHQRRYKALWTLYTSFLYIVIAAVLTLVTGWDKWSYLEYTAIAGSPVIIYGVRTGLDAYYNYRVANAQTYLNDLNQQREKAIQRLKNATKYDSTQQLLEKYGGAQKKQPSPQPKGKRQSEGGIEQNPPQNRTGLGPPPTANIPNRQPPPTANVPRPQAPVPDARLLTAPMPQNTSETGEEFAPNAFTAPSRPPAPRQPSVTQQHQGPSWMDRVLDLVMGEDETQARNRIALICQECRLVNGQAPPGARTLEEIGKWRCSACHAMNGVESEHKQALRAAGLTTESRPTSPVQQSAAATAAEHKNEREDKTEDESTSSDDVATAEVPAASVCSKARQRKAA